VTHAMRVDTHGRPSRLDVNGNRVFDLVYDGLGRLSGANLAGGAVLSTTFDPMTDLPTGYATTGPRPSSASWTLDERGLIDREITSAGSTTWDRTLSYDARGFLAGFTDSTGHVEQWGFDANGMPASIDDVAGPRALTRVGAVLTAGARQYSYDALGRVDAVDQRTLLYGPDGAIASVAPPAGASVDYVYDEAGQRVGKLRGGVPEAVYLSGTYLDASGSFEPVRIGGRIVGVVHAGAFEILETDPRGSLLADRTGGAPRELSPFGARATRPDISAALDYVEQGFDADLGTVRMGARDYDPFLAQFWTPDPLFLSRIDECARSPVECNLYGYARNNPLSFVDRTGKQAEGPSIGGLTVLGMMFGRAGSDTGTSIFWAGAKEAALHAVDTGLADEALETTHLYKVPQGALGPLWKFAKDLEKQGSPTLKNLIARFVFMPMSAIYGFQAGVSGRGPKLLINPDLKHPAGRIYTDVEAPAYKAGQRAIPTVKALGTTLQAVGFVLQATQDSPQVTGANPDMTDLVHVGDRMGSELDYFGVWVAMELGLHDGPLPPKPWKQ
jgi:RHS repeat-associated protein